MDYDDDFKKCAEEQCNKILEGDSRFTEICKSDGATPEEIQTMAENICYEAAYNGMMDFIRDL